MKTPNPLLVLQKLPSPNGSWDLPVCRLTNPTLLKRDSYSHLHKTRNGPTYLPDTQGTLSDSIVVKQGHKPSRRNVHGKIPHPITQGDLTLR